MVGDGTTPLDMGFITMQAASERYAVHYSRLRRWIQAGKLPTKTKRAFVRGGHRILVDAAILAILAKQPAVPGRPRTAIGEPTIGT